MMNVPSKRDVERITRIEINKIFNDRIKVLELAIDKLRQRLNELERRFSSRGIKK